MTQNTTTAKAHKATPVGTFNMRMGNTTYVNGNCLLLDDGEECVCVQSISYSLLCRWFKVAVLPLDAALCAEITKGRDEIKRCAVCGAAFTPNSNRAKYCPDCAVQVRRKKEAERQRKRYLLSTHLGR